MAKQSGGNTAQRVEALVRPTVEGMGLRLWDVVFEKEGPDWYLRVLIDKDGTMDTDTCAEVSHAIDQLMDEAMKLAEKICKNAQKAIRASKLAIRRGMDCDISTAVSYEALAFATCFGTEDQKEGMQAFLEKRKEKHFKNA